MCGENIPREVGNALRRMIPVCGYKPVSSGGLWFVVINVTSMTDDRF